MLGSDTAFMKLELVSAIEFGSEIPGWNDDDVNCEFIDPGSDVPGKKLLLEDIPFTDEGSDIAGAILLESMLLNKAVDLFIAASAVSPSSMSYGTIIFRLGAVVIGAVVGGKVNLSASGS